ncbi:MAG: dephospho-CoA kinase [Bacteroidales bacterium]|nr:dephospho-CoA kinase [Bacteroidales bacterium]
MIRVGLTGGIGSGKSTVARIFAALGIPVYAADTASKRILARADVRAQVLSLFPEIEADPDFSPDSFLSFTRALARLVFPSPERLAALNGLLHPLVFADCEAWLEKQAHGDGTAERRPPYAVVEAAILLESGLYRRMDRIISVECPVEIQIQRACRRDGVTEDMVRARLARQWSAEQRRPYADFVIENDGRQSVLAAVLAIDRQLH